MSVKPSRSLSRRNPRISWHRWWWDALFPGWAVLAAALVWWLASNTGGTEGRPIRIGADEVKSWTVLLRGTTTAMEARLSKSGFMRTNRSVILNLSRSKELQPLAAGEYLVLRMTGARWNMTCSLAKALNVKLAKLVENA